MNGSELSGRVAALRSASGMSMQQVAYAAGITKAHVCDIENGKSSNPSLAVLNGLCRAFGCPIGDLLDVSSPVVATETALNMGTDAMRIALGMKPRHASASQVVMWLAERADGKR